MTGQEALRRATVALRAAGVEEPAAEAELLLRHALRRDRTFLYVHLPDLLTAEEEHTFLDVVRKRLERRPTAYLTGVREFYGIEFYVAPGVLIPRPETELLVEESLRLLKARACARRDPTFADIGTGSGAIVIAVAKHWARARYLAVDRSSAALQIAGLNAHRPRLAGRIEFLCGDLVAPLPTRVDVIAANLPYVRTEDWQGLPPEIRDYEPREALDGGTDGLDVIRRLIDAAPSKLEDDGAVLLEIGDGQSDAVLELLAGAFPTARRYLLSDLAEIPRLAAADCGCGELPPGAIVR